MDITPWNFVGAFIMLVVGLLNYALLRRVIYRPLRMRHERAKAYGQRTLDPSRLFDWLKVLNLLVLPAFGFLVGNSLLAPLAQ